MSSAESRRALYVEVYGKNESFEENNPDILTSKNLPSFKNAMEAWPEQEIDPMACEAS